MEIPVFGKVVKKFSNRDFYTREFAGTVTARFMKVFQVSRVQVWTEPGYIYIFSIKSTVHVPYERALVKHLRNIVSLKFKFANPSIYPNK